MVKKSFSPHIIPKTKGLEESLNRYLIAIKSSPNMNQMSHLQLSIEALPWSIADCNPET